MLVRSLQEKKSQCVCHEERMRKHNSRDEEVVANFLLDVGKGTQDRVRMLREMVNTVILCVAESVP